MSQPAKNQAGAESVYFAQPYSLCATGFYFETLADYRTKADALRDDCGRPVEEFELQYIDGDFHQLFNALSVSQVTLGAWFELLEELDAESDRYLIACHLVGDGYPMDELADRWDDYFIYHGTAEDYAFDLIEDCEDLPDRITAYIDYERLGRDIMLEGDVSEIEREVLVVG